MALRKRDALPVADACDPAMSSRTSRLRPIWTRNTPMCDEFFVSFLLLLRKYGCRGAAEVLLHGMAA